jgi:hypothetical protein
LEQALGIGGLVVSDDRLDAVCGRIMEHVSWFAEQHGGWHQTLQHHLSGYLDYLAGVPWGSIVPDDWRFIQYGKGRVVFQVGQDDVVKFSHNPIHGVTQNRNEVDTWKSSVDAPWHGKLLPVLGHGRDFCWVRMPLVIPFDTPFFSNHFSRAEEAVYLRRCQEVIDFLASHFIPVNELWEGNFGVRGDEIKLVDYGY